MKKLLFITLSTYLFSNTLTIYNNNLAHINESREFNLKAGLQNITFSDLPKSTILDSLSPQFHKDGIKILSQSFYSNPIDSYKLLDANLNKDVEFFTKDKKRLSGKLVSINPNIIKSSGKYYIVPSDDIIYSQLPTTDNKPYINWEVESKEATKSKVELSYLINGINWSSNYVLNLNSKSLDLRGWAKISNNTQKEFKDVNLSLISGEVNRQMAKVMPRVYRKKMAMSAALFEDAAVIAPKAISGYYLYSVPNRVTLKPNEIKEVLLIDAKQIGYKRYGVATNRNFGNYGTNRLDFAQVIEFKNSKKEHLGLPMPQGVVRVYKDKHYLGSSNIRNTAPNERVKLTIGQFFDAVGEKKITKFVSKDRFKNIETTYTLKNRGNENLVLKINENIPRYGDKINFKTSCSGVCSFNKKSAFVREFTINLQPKSSYKFTTEFEVYY